MEELLTFVVGASRLRGLLDNVEVDFEMRILELLTQERNETIFELHKHIGYLLIVYGDFYGSGLIIGDGGLHDAHPFSQGGFFLRHGVDESLPLERE